MPEENDYRDVVGLTDEELEAMKDDETSPETLETEAVEVEVETSPETPETEGVEVEVETSPETPETEAVEVEVEVETNPETPETEPQKSLEEYYSELKGARNKITTELRQKYNAGELDFDEYEKQKDALANNYETEKEKLDAAKFSQMQQTERASLDWQATQRAFFKSNPQFENPIAHGALSAALTALYENPANARKSQAVLLEEAADNVKTAMGLNTPKPAPEPVKIPAKVTAELPKTLANVPAAAANIEAGEFDNLDKLKGEAFEQAFGKLTAEQRKRYMA